MILRPAHTLAEAFSNAAFDDFAPALVKVASRDYIISLRGSYSALPSARRRHASFFDALLISARRLGQCFRRLTPARPGSATPPPPALGAALGSPPASPHRAIAMSGPHGCYRRRACRRVFRLLGRRAGVGMSRCQPHVSSACSHLPRRRRLYAYVPAGSPDAGGFEASERRYSTGDSM